MALALGLVVAGSLRAQNMLLVEYEGRAAIVRGAAGARPVIEQDGRQQVIRANRFALKPVEEYVPVFVAVREPNVTSYTTTTEDAGAEFNNELRYRAWFESPFGLENVFVVLDLRGEKAGHLLFLYEVGRLEPRTPKQVSILVPMTFSLGQGRYDTHVFVDGNEVLNSSIPSEVREAALDRMVAKRVARLANADLQLFVGPAPEYPERLRRSQVKGRAIVAVRVTARGQPVDVVAKEATDPAFGEAAVTAVRQWRFLPPVRNGKPVETAAEIPFAFAPPAAEK